MELPLRYYRRIGVQDLKALSEKASLYISSELCGWDYMRIRNSSKSHKVETLRNVKNILRELKGT